MFAGGNSTFVRLRNDAWVAWGGVGTPNELSEASVGEGLLPDEARGFEAGDTSELSPVEVAAPWGFGCMLRRSGEVFCWGDNALGQCGDGTTRGPEVRHAPAINNGATAIAAGVQFACAAMRDGTARCWGRNNTGQLGNGHVSDAELRATTVVGLSNVVDLARGFPRDHMCARMRDGGAYCWGNNSDGQLGDGTTTSSTVPVRVVGLPACVAQLAISDNTTFARLVDGSLWAWGSNENRLIETISHTSDHRPMHIEGMENIADLAVGVGFVCVVIDTGAVRCWGDNSYGQVGIGRRTAHEFLESGLFVGVPAVVQLVAGVAHVCARTRAADIYCWGADGGAIGIPDRLGSTTPARVNYRRPFDGGP